MATLKEIALKERMLLVRVVKYWRDEK